MRKADAVSYYGSVTKLAAELGRVQSTVSEYPDPLPLEAAMLVEKLTKGKLKVDYSLYPDNRLPPKLREGRA